MKKQPPFGLVFKRYKMAWRYYLKIVNWQCIVTLFVATKLRIYISIYYCCLLYAGTCTPVSLELELFFWQGWTSWWPTRGGLLCSLLCCRAACAYLLCWTPGHVCCHVYVPVCMLMCWTPGVLDIYVAGRSLVAGMYQCMWLCGWSLSAWHGRLDTCVGVCLAIKLCC